jgi:hypothetical protein
MNTKLVYTYYEPIDELQSREYKQDQLIEICKKSWEKNGWELVILDHSTSIKHAFYKEYSDIVNKFPSVNPTPYDYHCYMRWLAMSQIGGGLMIDYDVININFQNKNNSILTNTKNLSILQGHVPCVVYGSSKQYLEVSEKFCKLVDDSTCYIKINDKPHTSDMIMLANGFSNSDVNKINYVVDYPAVGSLIHCAQNICEFNQKNKLEAMNELLNI